MPVTLAKPAVDSLDREKRVRELLNEFFKAWFDGEDHAAELGSDVPVVFPKCEIAFQSTFPNNALPILHTVISFGESRSQVFSGGGIKWDVKVDLTQIIRVAKAGESGNQADHLAGEIVDKLRLLYETPSLRAVLAGKKIFRPKVRSGSRPVAMAGYQLRQMTVEVSLTYVVA